MGKYYQKLAKDVRFKQGLNACMNCGVCTAICPAAEFYDYDPRQVCNILLSRNEEKITELLETDTIWYCGQCVSCKSRCPRGNTPALLISALRKLSQEEGLFVKCEKGRQQFAVYKTIGKNILETGYCVHVDHVDPKLHPEQGPVWKWFFENIADIDKKIGANYNKDGSGALRKIPEKNLDEVRRIFEVTGGMVFFDKISDYSVKKAKEMNMVIDNNNKDEYFFHVYIANSERKKKQK